MNERIWYLPGAGNQPRGPFTADEVLDKYNRGEIDDRVFVFRHGTAQWVPLPAVELFASGIAEIKRLRRRRRRPVLISTLLVLLLLAAIGGGAAAYFFIFREPSEIRGAREMIGAGLYAEARQRLSAFIVAHPGDRRAQYYLAVANASLYATRKSGPFDLPDGQDLLGSARSLLQQAFQDSAWREKAKPDFAQVADRVRADAGDAAERLLAIHRLRHELDLADGKELARSLLDWAAKRPATPGSAIWGPWCDQVLKWDPSVADEVVKRTLPVAGGSMFDSDMRFSPWLDAVRQWGAGNPSAAEPLSLALVKCGEDESKRGKADKEGGKPQDAARSLARARQMLALAGQINPDLKTDLAQRLDELNKMLDPNEQRYQESVDAARKAIAADRFDQAAASLQEALRLRPADAVASKLLEQAEEGRRKQSLGKDAEQIKSLLAERQAARALQSAETVIKKWGKTPELTGLREQATDMLASDHKEKAKAAIDSRDFQAALREAAAAQGLRPEDAEARDLQRRARQGQTDTWKTSGTQARDRKDFDSAVKAFSQAVRAAPEDNEAKTLLEGAVHEQVKGLISQASMRYSEARQAVAAVQLLLSDAIAKELLDETANLEKDPKTTNLTGFWSAPGGAIRLDGTDKIIAIKMGPNRTQLQDTGSWQRDGDKLTGNFLDARGKPFKAMGTVVDRRSIQVDVRGKPSVIWTKEEDAVPQPPK